MARSRSFSKCVTSAEHFTGSSLRRHSFTGVGTISFVLFTILRSAKSIPLTTLLWGRLKKLKSQFGRHGIQETCVSDNGSQVTSTEFREFSRQWNFVPCNEFSNLSANNGKVEARLTQLKCHEEVKKSQNRSISRSPTLKKHA